MEIVFELEEIPGGIFEKERVVLEAAVGEPDAGLLIEGQPFRLGLIQELLPRVFRQEYQAEMAGINALLRWQWFRDQMRHELVPRESKRDGVARLPTQRTTESIDIETASDFRLQTSDSGLLKSEVRGLKSGSHHSSFPLR